MTDAQLRRYFLGLVGFGFVAAWAALGLLDAVAALAACAAITAGPELIRARTAKRQRPPQRRRPPVIVEGELPMVPDEPSLVLELGSFG